MQIKKSTKLLYIEAIVDREMVPKCANVNVSPNCAIFCLKEVSKFPENSSVLADWAWSNLFSDNLDQTPIKYSKLI